MAEREWVTFVFDSLSKSGKTGIWIVQGFGGPTDIVGTVTWHAHWRKYAFVSNQAIYDPACLDQISKFLREATADQRRGYPARTKNPVTGSYTVHIPKDPKTGKFK